MDNSFTPYDDAWRTMLNDAPRTLFPLINEMFKNRGIHLTGKEKLEFSANEIYLNRQDGEQSKRITDSSFTINDGGIIRRFHIECQSSTDGSMVVRMFEYDAQIALNDARNNWESGDLFVKFPESGILYLRSTENMPDFVTTTIEVPSGETVSYNIPALKISDYSAEDIVEKKLFFLIPFYLFNFEKYFEQIEEGDEKIIGQMLNQLGILSDALKEARKSRELKETELMSIAGMFKKVLEHLTIDHENVRKEVLNNMGGKVLNYPQKTAYKLGDAERLVRAVQKSMEKYHVSLEDACDGCDSSLDEYNRAVDLLKNENEQ
ncbi:hypothetical protein [Butyrivibrio proteoclasticus]|uniref:hypothetical protein n=1 Tax=Butyrivibrio proteoclasticus TaxID=43305 RepID=UPI000684892F|nr:hypothetical protein [Butyrivibrio proteoclasticus]